MTGNVQRVDERGEEGQAEERGGQEERECERGGWGQ